jgi:hypothetical protein
MCLVVLSVQPPVAEEKEKNSGLGVPSMVGPSPNPKSIRKTECQIPASRTFHLPCCIKNPQPRALQQKKTETTRAVAKSGYQ